MAPPWDEADRLACLQGYDILDSADDAVFDDFVQIAAEICDSPIAVVNLIDADRQWFVAEKGLAVRQTPLDVSICAHAIRQPGLMVVPDLTQDHRFAANPLVTGAPRLRFYAGALLRSPEGLPLGTICVLDTTSRPAGLTARQAATLEALARQVMAQLALRKALVQIELAAAEKELLVLEAHHRVKNSLSMVQSLLLMQARATTHGEARQQLRDSAARVQIFGAMHEHLYRGGSAAAVDLAAYLASLIDHQRAALASTLEDRVIDFTAAAISWPSSDAPSVGLMLMELVTNALKHGQGAISVSLTREGARAVLRVADQGAALPDDFDPRQSRGLGMRVLTGLLGTRQGSMTVDRAAGRTCFVITLPCET